MSSEVINVTPNLACATSDERRKLVCEFLRGKCLSGKLIHEIFACGLTDEITRKLQLLGFTCEDIVKVEEALKKDEKDNGSDDFCDCTTESETTIKSVSSKESNYLREHLGAILPLALREIALRKPYDPVEYLGQWLLHFRECEERERRRREFEEELLEERLKWQEETVTVYIPSDGGESGEECEHDVGN